MFEETGLVGEDFLLAFSPERVDPAIPVSNSQLPKFWWESPKLNEVAGISIRRSSRKARGRSARVADAPSSWRPRFARSHWH